MKSRAQVIEIASLREFDLIVIGGGIAGAGIAQDAASRGMSVLLVDKDDFASGTSSRTSKLMHGNLPQVENLKIKQSRDLHQERALLAQLAPHLIRDFSFLLPIKKQEKISGWKAKLGLTLFDFVSGAKVLNNNHQSLTQKELLEAAPALTSPELVGGIRFHDWLTDDARLVIEVIKSASADGANAINYMQVKGFQEESGRITAVLCHDRYSGATFTFRCKSCVLAVGVWTDELFKTADDSWQNKVETTKRTHLTLPMSAFETNNALFLPTADGKHISLVPWQRALLVGPCEAPYKGDLNNPLPQSSDIDYLLDAINSYKPTRKLTRNDVVAAWSGLHPVVSRSGDALGQVSKNSKQSANKSGQTLHGEIITGPKRLLAVVGGDLEAYRSNAEEVVDRLIRAGKEQSIDLPSSQSRSKRTMIGGWKDKNDFLTQTAIIAASARKQSLEPATLDHLIESYGQDAQLIIDLVERQPLLSERICPDFPPIMAEVAYCALSEMSVSLEDLLFRRMRLACLHQIQCRQAATKAAALMQSLLSWDDARAALELQTLENTLDAHMDSFRAIALTNGKTN